MSNLTQTTHGGQRFFKFCPVPITAIVALFINRDGHQTAVLRYPSGLYSPPNATRDALRLARERGYGKGMLRFKVERRDQ